MAGLWKEKKKKKSYSENEFLEISTNRFKGQAFNFFLGMETDGLVANYKWLSFRRKNKCITITSS